MLEEAHAPALPAASTPAKRSWVASLQPRSRRRAACRSCRNSFNPEELRITPQKYATTRSWYYHWHCVHDGIAPQDIVNDDALDDNAKKELRSMPRGQAGPTDAGILANLATATTGDTMDTDDGISTMDLLTADPVPHDFTDNQLRSMEWWDDMDWRSAAQAHVPTWEAIPDEVRDAVAEAREVVLQEYLSASTPDAREQHWRLAQFMDRLLFWRASKTAETGDRAEMVVARLHLFWRGAWDELWAAAHPGPQENNVLKRGRGQKQTLEARVERIEEFVSMGQIGKAMRIIDEKLPLIDDHVRLPQFAALFPPAPSSDHVIAPGAWAAIPPANLDWEAIRAAIGKTLDTLPRRVAPGLTGSRYEHWQPPKGNGTLRDLTIRVMEDWLRGNAPAEAYVAEHSSRLLGFDRGEGKVRTVLVGGSVRRIALTAFMKATKDLAVKAVGQCQFALGRQGGAEGLYHLLRCHSEADGEAIIGAADLRNAFGTISRMRALESLTRRCPWAARIFALLYEGTSEHYWHTDVGIRNVRAESGIDPGCPLSVLAFLCVMADIMEETRAFIRSHCDAGPRDTVVGYMDDAYLAVRRGLFGPALAAFKLAAGVRNMELQESKTKLWSSTGSRHSLTGTTVQSRRLASHFGAPGRGPGRRAFHASFGLTGRRLWAGSR